MVLKNLRRMPGKRKHMRKPKILVVGSLVMDQIATTRVFPRQGQTVLGERFDKAPGGKGSNQAVQAARLGAEVTMVGKLGRDANGEEMLNASRASGVHTEHIMLDDKTASGCCVIILEVQPDGSTQNRILVIPGANMAITPQDVEFLREEVANYDLVMLQLEIPMQINELVAGFAHAKGVPVMLNPAPSAPLSDELLRCLTFISPNEHEAEDLTGIHIRHEGKNINWQDVELAAKSLRDRGVKNVLITLGSAGAALCNENGIFHSPCAEGITAVDPTAAGDSFLGAFCAGYCCGWDWETLLCFANHTAAITVSGMGAMPSLPKLAQVKSLLTERTGCCPDTSALEK